MPCPAPTIYTSKPMPRAGSAGIGGAYNINVNSYFNSQPNLYIGFGLSCADAHDAIFPSLPILVPTVVADGSIIARPTAANFGMVDGSAVSLYVDGVFSGSFGQSGGVFADDTTFAWPGIAGVNFVENLQFLVSGVGGQNSTMDYPINSLDFATFDADLWWCCNATGCVPGGCGGPAINLYAPRFLIPPPTTPAPGEENATQPPLNSLLLLTNHTFQFPNNFGVNKK